MRLGVNVDHVATLRQARGGPRPDPVDAALVCERAGAHSIVMHLREDRRHVQDKDLFLAKRRLKIGLNMEMSIAPSVLAVALKLKPHQSTLVPEKRRERTTEGGLDLRGKSRAVQSAIDQLKKSGVEVSLFIDPDERQVRLAKKFGADAVEFHTGDYANARTAAVRRKEIFRLERAVQATRAQRLVAHAGHGLDYENVGAIARVTGLTELNIGYSIVTRALWTGLDKAVRDMRRLIT